jgi:hypothetical protein
MLDPPAIFQPSTNDLAESIGTRFLMVEQQRNEDRTSIVASSSPDLGPADFDTKQVQKTAEHNICYSFDQSNKATSSFVQTAQLQTKRGGNVCETCNKVSHLIF